jgi:hypothetical protein
MIVRYGRARGALAVRIAVFARAARRIVAAVAFFRAFTVSVSAERFGRLLAIRVGITFVIAHAAHDIARLVRIIAYGVLLCNACRRLALAVYAAEAVRALRGECVAMVALLGRDNGPVAALVGGADRDALAYLALVAGRADIRGYVPAVTILAWRGNLAIAADDARLDDLALAVFGTVGALRAFVGFIASQVALLGREDLSVAADADGLWTFAGA